MAQTFNYHALPVEMESVSAVTATNSVDLGTVRVTGGAEYVYVYNAGADVIGLGQIAVLSCNSGYSVTASSITGFDLPIGVCANATIATGSYGWLMTRGFTRVQNGMASTVLALRDVIAPAALGGVQTVLTPTLTTGPYIGSIVSACASGSCALSLALAYVRCFGS